MLFSKQRQINVMIPDNNKEGLSDTIKVIRPGTIKDIYMRIHITHGYTGDLEIELVSPAGTSVKLHKKTKKAGKNLSLIFEGASMKKFKGQKAKGNWKLTVRDGASKDVGMLNNWTMGFSLEQKSSEAYLSNVSKDGFSSKHHCHENGKVKSIKGSIDLAHSKSNNLTIQLVAPSGKAVTLFKKQKSAKKNLKKAFPKDLLQKFVGEKAKGVWSLNVKDSAKTKSGRLKKWALDIAVA